MTNAAPVQSSTPRQGVLARHPLIFFFLLTFVISWGWGGCGRPCKCLLP